MKLFVPGRFYEVLFNLVGHPVDVLQVFQKRSCRAEKQLQHKVSLIRKLQVTVFGVKEKFPDYLIIIITNGYDKVMGD
jgi:hypothetical protein